MSEYVLVSEFRKILESVISSIHGTRSLLNWTYKDHHQNILWNFLIHVLLCFHIFFVQDWEQLGSDWITYFAWSRASFQEITHVAICVYIFSHETSGNANIFSEIGSVVTTDIFLFQSNSASRYVWISFISLRCWVDSFVHSL